MQVTIHNVNGNPVSGAVAVAVNRATDTIHEAITNALGVADFGVLTFGADYDVYAVSGSTTTQARIVTETESGGGGGGGTLDATVQSYVDAVNAARTAVGQPAMGSTEASRLNEFWLRLSNRDAELSGDLSGSLVEAITLRSAYNVGAGTLAKGLLGTDWNYIGSGGAWGAAGYDFGGPDAFVSPGLRFTGVPISVLAFARSVVDSSGAGAVVSQYSAGAARRVYLINGASETPGRWTFLLEAGGGTHFFSAGTPRSGTSFDSVLLTYEADGVRGYAAGSSTVAATKLVDLSTWVPLDVDLAVGGSQDLTGTGTPGEVALVLLFSSIISPADYAQLHAIVQQTIGTGIPIN